MFRRGVAGTGMPPGPPDQSSHGLRRSDAFPQVSDVPSVSPRIDSHGADPARAMRRRGDVRRRAVGARGRRGRHDQMGSARRRPATLARRRRRRRAVRQLVQRRAQRRSSRSSRTRASSRSRRSTGRSPTSASASARRCSPGRSTPPVVKAPVREVGYEPIRTDDGGSPTDPLVAHYADGDRVFQWHMDTFELPDGRDPARDRRPRAAIRRTASATAPGACSGTSRSTARDGPVAELVRGGTDGPLESRGARRRRRSARKRTVTSSSTKRRAARCSSGSPTRSSTR